MADANLADAKANLADANSHLPGLPRFKHHSVAIDPANLRYNPTNDIIFPSVIETAPLKNAMGKYYLYFAPHDPPGGICLAYSDRLEGPWTEYPSNPIIGRAWEPHYAVSHVSSPDVIWMPEHSRLFCYFHGENTHTRFAASTDGIHFEYGGVAVESGMFDNITECSYARVQRHAIAGKSNRYILMTMGNNQGTRKNYLAWSNDGQSWTTQRTPFIEPPPGYNQIGAPTLLEWHGKHYIIYLANLSDSPTFDPVSDLCVSEVDDRFEKVRYVGKLLDHTSVSPENKRQSDPYIVRENGKLYLFTAIRARLKQQIGLAIADAK